MDKAKIDNAISQIERKGYEVYYRGEFTIRFFFKKEIVLYYPCSGWACGESIEDCKGLENLLQQI